MSQHSAPALQTAVGRDVDMASSFMQHAHGGNIPSCRSAT
jgi:hypothetical protein